MILVHHFPLIQTFFCLLYCYLKLVTIIYSTLVNDLMTLFISSCRYSALKQVTGNNATTSSLEDDIET